MLIRQHARREAASTLIWAVALGFVGFITTYLWRVVLDSGSLNVLEETLEAAPGMVKAMIGTGGLAQLGVDGWVQAYVLANWIAVPYAIFTALFVAGMVTREMDQRSMEFLLSLPVSRARLLVARWLVLLGSLFLLHLAHLTGIRIGLAVLGEAGSLGRYAVAEANSLLLYLFLGSLLLAVSLFIDDYGTGAGAVLGLGVGLMLGYMATGESTGVLQRLRSALPLAFYDVHAIVMQGDVPWGHMAFLGGGALLLLALSVWLFERKQIAV